MVGGSDLIHDRRRPSSFNRDKSPISSGRVDKRVDRRSRSLRFSNLPMEGGSNVIPERERFNLFRLFKSPIASGRCDNREMDSVRYSRFFNRTIEGGRLVLSLDCDSIDLSMTGA